MGIILVVICAGLAMSHECLDKRQDCQHIAKTGFCDDLQFHGMMVR